MQGIFLSFQNIDQFQRNLNVFMQARA